MAAAALHEGEVFAGRYRVVRELASGGMGAVYEVIHAVTERRCALKVMLAHTVEREQLRKRFMQESRLAAQIGSEYIVDVLDAGVDEGTKAPYLVMELLEGEDLGQRLLRQGPLTRQEGVQYLWHVALALDRTHVAGIVHRDLKASNLFLTRREDGSVLVKVLDFGVAKVLTLERSGGEQRTQTVGTPIYMAPEQFRAEGRISAATDIYALGMLSYTLLVGVHYWTQEHEKCENPFAFASIAVHGPKQEPSLRAAREGVLLPDAFDVWFAKATARWPQDRFATATEAIAELARALDAESSLVPAPSGALPHEVIPLPSASGSQLPATLEAASGRVPASGAHLGTPSHGGVALDPSSGGAGQEREHHTEVSLTITSGGLQLDPGARPRRPGRAVAIALAAALAGGIVAVAFARPWWEGTGDGASKMQAVPPSPSADTVASAKPAEPRPKAFETLDIERSATPIEDLPLAPPDSPVVASPPPLRPGPQRPPQKPRPGGTRPPGAQGDTAPQVNPGAQPGASGGGAKPGKREDLYGQD